MKTSKDFEDMMRIAKSPAYQEMIKISHSPEAIKAYENAVRITKHAFIPKSLNEVPPAALKLHASAVKALEGLDIAQLNSMLSIANQIPHESFQEIRQSIAQNRSELRDATKANYETASNMVKKASESGSDETLVFPEAVAELITDIDDSLNMPEPDADKKVHIPLSWKDMLLILSTLLTVLGFAHDLYQGYSSSKSNQQQTGYLKHIEENTASTNSIDQPSEEPPKNKEQ